MTTTFTDHPGLASTPEIPSEIAVSPDLPPTTVGVSLDDFLAFMPTHKYLYIPTGDLWPAASVNGNVPAIEGPTGEMIKPSAWLDSHAAVHQAIWAPGKEILIKDHVVADGGWFPKAGACVFNLYRPPVPLTGDPAKAIPWIEHVHCLYPDDAVHIILWMAHRVQRPGEKINHAVILGGAQGIGKDTILEPVKRAVGPWNFQEIAPTNLFDSFNPHVKAVVLRVNEARDLGDVDGQGFYERMKTYTAAPPDVLLCNEKNLRQQSVFNVCGVIITTNHKTALYLPPDDRRHYVAWSPLEPGSLSPSYYAALYAWYAAGGSEHVAAYLMSLDITKFNPKAPPPKTAAWHAIVDSNRTAEDSELADALDALGMPAAVTLDMIGGKASPDLRSWLQTHRNRRLIPLRLESASYTPVRNFSAKDGMWKINERRQTIYARASMTPADRIVAARELIERK